MAIKERIRMQRILMDMTLEEVAKKVGVTRATIQKYESGAISNIPQEKIEMLAKALNTTPVYLMGLENVGLEEKMYFNNEELSIIGRALLDAAGRLKEHLGRMCEAEPSYPSIKDQYDLTAALAKRIVEENWKKLEVESWKKITGPDETGDSEKT